MTDGPTSDERYAADAASSPRHAATYEAPQPVSAPIRAADHLTINNTTNVIQRAPYRRTSVLGNAIVILFTGGLSLFIQIPVWIGRRRQNRANGY